MKIYYSFIKGILLISSLGVYFSCSEPFPELPPETQSGEGAFGCLVNNELVFAVRSGNSLYANATYDVNANQLKINARCQSEQQFSFIIDDPYKKQDTLIDTLRYLPPDSGEWMEATQTGHFQITRLDSINNDSHVVSGTFFFDLNETGKTPIHVTKGRFDLYLNIY
ncbi:MAG: hypothetical protein FWD60_13375 [Candidatus Azobacteroides sp.]|nr:hypothetical protein [Candidatus Azobacteroides sp.]